MNAESANLTIIIIVSVFKEDFVSACRPLSALLGDLCFCCPPPPHIKASWPLKLRSWNVNTGRGARSSLNERGRASSRAEAPVDTRVTADDGDGTKPRRVQAET